jgi:hypothetical protein
MNFFQMKCCSFLPNDLHKHIKRMSEIFYILNGGNDPSLKRVFFASFPEELHHDMERLVQATNRSLEEFGLGELVKLFMKLLIFFVKNIRLLTSSLNNILF